MFCHCFCFIAWRCSPESCLKNYPILRSAFRENFGSELLVFGVCALSIFFGVLPMFLLHCMALFPREPSENIILFLGPCFEKIFGCELLVFVLCRYSLVMFCLCFCFIAWRCSPESRLKKIILCLGPRFEKIFGCELLVFGFCALSIFFGDVLPRFFASLHGVVPLRAV